MGARISFPSKHLKHIFQRLQLGGGQLGHNELLSYYQFLDSSGVFDLSVDKMSDEQRALLSVLPAVYEDKNLRLCLSYIYNPQKASKLFSKKSLEDQKNILQVLKDDTIVLHAFSVAHGDANISEVYAFRRVVFPIIVENVSPASTDEGWYQFSGLSLGQQTDKLEKLLSCWRELKGDFAVPAIKCLEAIEKTYQHIHKPKTINSLDRKIYTEANRYWRANQLSKKPQSDALEEINNVFFRLQNKYYPEACRIQSPLNASFGTRKGADGNSYGREAYALRKGIDPKRFFDVAFHEFTHCVQYELSAIYKENPRRFPHQDWHDYARLCSMNFTHYLGAVGHSRRFYKSQFVEFAANLFFGRSIDKSYRFSSFPKDYRQISIQRIKKNKSRLFPLYRRLLDFATTPVSIYRKENGLTAFFLETPSHQSAEALIRNIYLLTDGRSKCEAQLIVDMNGKTGVFWEIYNIDKVNNGLDCYENSDLRHRDPLIDFNLNYFNESEKAPYDWDHLSDYHRSKVRNRVKRIDAGSLQPARVDLFEGDELKRVASSFCNETARVHHKTY